MEEVKNHRIVTFLVRFPSFGSNIFIGTIATVVHLNVGFLFDPIEILVQTVQEER